jgi:hypothetical protein
VKEHDVRVRRSRFYHLAFAIVAAVLVLGSSSAWAQCTAQDLAFPKDAPTTQSLFVVLIKLETNDCLGGPRDTTMIAVAVREALKVAADDATLFQPAARKALVAIDDHLQNTTTPASPEILRDARQQVGLTLATLGSGVSPALPTAWELDQGRIFVISQSLQGYVDSACKTRDQGCITAFDTTKEVLRVARLTRLALLRSETKVLRDTLAENLKREKSWNDYFDRARSQYIWELALNSWRLGDTRQKVDGVSVGFRDVPTSQIILLHPYVAMEYAKSEPDGNKFNGTVLIDLVGYNRWGWKPDGSMGFAIGGSLILAASDHIVTDNIALGAMLHVNHQWSIGLVFGGDDPTVVVSGDVAQLWTKVSALRKTKMMTGSK